MSSEYRLLDFLRKQIELENKIVNSLNDALVDIKNPAVKGVLKGISLDSVKHAEIYGAAVELLTRAPERKRTHFASQALAQEQLDKQKELVEEHIRLEEGVIEEINNELSSIKNEKVSLLINAILLDEERHHELLRDVLVILVRGETITDKDWLDILWKSVPFHGAT